MVFTNQGSVQVFYPGSYFCEIIVVFVNFNVIFVKKLHAINFNYWIKTKHEHKKEDKTETFFKQTVKSTILLYLYI